MNMKLQLSNFISVWDVNTVNRYLLIEGLVLDTRTDLMISMSVVSNASLRTWCYNTNRHYKYQYFH